MKNNDTNVMYEQNMRAIKEGNIYLWDSLNSQAESEETEGTEVVPFVDVSMKDETIIGVETGTDIWYFNSRYQAREAAKLWAAGCEVKNYQAVVLVFGFGNGMYLEELRKRNPENVIVVYEPRCSLFRTAIENIDLSEILGDENIFIAVGKDGLGLFTEYAHTFLTYTRYKLTTWQIIPNYRNMFEMEYLKVLHIYMYKMRNLVLDRNTALITQSELAENSFKNMYDCLQQFSIEGLRKQFRWLNMEKRPAVVVSAGPSLDKNINELKEAKGKAILIVVDTALKAVLRAGITPDIAITVDPHKPLVLFEEEGIAEIPLIVSLGSNAEVIKQHRGMRIYADTSFYLDKIFRRYRKKIFGLETGGSVGNDAFSVAVKLGCRTIILVGQDLAYPNGKEHTKDAYDDDEKNQIGMGKKYYEVEDIYGGSVLTEPNMHAYRVWFETQIVRYPLLRVIDATEGGAKIRGTEILTLREAITRECGTIEMIDYEAVIKKTPPNFTEKQLWEITQKLYDIPKRLREIEKKVKKGIKEYQKLKVLGNKTKLDAEQVKKCAEKIEKLNKWLEKSPEMSLTENYNQWMEYRVQEEVFEIKDTPQEEFVAIAENGMKMLASYLEAIQALDQDLPILYENMKS